MEKKPKKKKDDDDAVIIFIGLGAIAYFLFHKKKTVATPIQSIVPVNNAAATPVNNTSGLATALQSITNLISPTPAPTRTDPLTAVEIAPGVTSEDMSQVAPQPQQAYVPTTDIQSDTGSDPPPVQEFEQLSGIIGNPYHDYKYYN